MEFPSLRRSGMAASVSLARVIFVDPIVEQVEDYKRVWREFAADAMIVDIFGFGPMMFGDEGPDICHNVSRAKDQF